MHSNEVKNFYNTNKNAHDAMINMIITFEPLQILPPLKESRPEIQTKAWKRIW